MPSALSLPRISTNVRFAASAFLSPDLAGAWAERLFLTPPRPKDAALTSLDLIDAKSGQLEHRGRTIATWTWGARSQAAPAVLLAHGWGGNAAQMRAFVFPLLSAGYRVVAFDQPAHGVSEGRLTGLPDFAEVLAHVAWRAGTVHGVIAHSLGGTATNVAVAAVGQAPLADCSAIAFDATGSHDPEGGELRYLWDFGDGSSAEGPAVVHAYAAPGTYEAALLLLDGSTQIGRCSLICSPSSLIGCGTNVE